MKERVILSTFIEIRVGQFASNFLDDLDVLEIC